MRGPPALLLLAVLVAVPPRATAETFLEAFTAKAFTQGANVHVRQPSRGNDFRVEDLRFDDESFRAPPWYGIRAGYFPERLPWLGGAIEFFHFKMLGETGERRRIHGTRGGARVDERERVDSVVQRFDVSHGVNYVAADLIVRRRLLRSSDRFPNGRLQPYAGFGLGAVIAHPENRIDGVPNRQHYETGGFGVQAFAGVRALLREPVGLLLEYKLTHSGLGLGVASGEAELDETSHHLVAGVTLVLPAFGSRR